MIDERFDRDLRFARQQLGTDIGLLFQAVRDAFRALTPRGFEPHYKVVNPVKQGCDA